MGDGSNHKSINEKEGSDPEKPPIKRLRVRLNGLNIQGHAVCDTRSSDRSLPALNDQVKAGSDTEEGEIIRSPDAYAESKQQSGDGLPPSTKEKVADHEAVSDHNLGKSKPVRNTSCRICGRKFPSAHSLYGHMRKHTRDWKGVSPPPEKKTQVPSTATDFNNSYTILRLLPPLNWAVRGKRGRKGKAAAYRKHEEESEDPVINAANALMLLANGCFSLNSTLVRQQQCRNPVQHDSRVMNNEDDLKITTPTQMDNVDKTEGSNQNINRLMIDCKPTEKTYKLETATDLAADRKQYSCSTCNKSFSTPQALGGHTASHNKSKSNAGAGISVGVEGAKLARAEGLIGQGGGLPMKVSEHRCKTCGLVFPTGQALGGHMRKHWLGPENVVAPSAVNRPETVVAPSAQNGPENVVAPSAENRPENFVAPSADNGPENFVAPSAENGRENFVAPPKENHFRYDFDLNEPAQSEDAE